MSETVLFVHRAKLEMQEAEKYTQKARKVSVSRLVFEAPHLVLLRLPSVGSSSSIHSPKMRSVRRVVNFKFKKCKIYPITLLDAEKSIKTRISDSKSIFYTKFGGSLRFALSGLSFFYNFAGL